MGIKIKFNDILKVAGILLPLAPVIVKAGKGIIKSKGKDLPDTITDGVALAEALGQHNDRLDELTTVIKMAQGMGILPHKDGVVRPIQ